MRYVEFRRAVVVDGRAFGPGERVPAKDIHPDYLACCLRVGHCGVCDPPPDAKPIKK